MPLLESVEIEGYRCFKKLRVDGLSDVTLIVGKNNAGKTALLEAIEAVAWLDNPFLLYRPSAMRGEFRYRIDGGSLVEIDVRRWFYGHVLEEGATLAIRSAGANGPQEVGRKILRVAADAPSPPYVPGGLQVTHERPTRPVIISPQPLTPDGFVAVHRERLLDVPAVDPPLSFITSSPAPISDLSTLWAKIVLRPDEALVIDALRIVEPRVSRIAISQVREQSTAQVLLHGSSAPVPLGSVGDGTTRMLSLAIHLAITRRGILLVDEIETGLHWSVMPKLWHFLVKTALDLGVQVFATTHSKDCIEGLAALHREHPDLAAHVSVHRLEAGRETSVRFDAAHIASDVDLAIEDR